VEYDTPVVRLTSASVKLAGLAQVTVPVSHVAGVDRHVDGHRVERIHLIPGVVTGHAFAVALGADLLHGVRVVAVESRPRKAAVGEGRTGAAHAGLYPGRR